MQSAYQPQPAPESDGMQGPATVTSRTPRELPQDFRTQHGRTFGMNSQQDLNYSVGGAQRRTPQFPQGVQQATPEPPRTRNPSDSYTPPAPFNMENLHAALPHERDPNAGAASQWSQSNPQYSHVQAPGGYGYGYDYAYGHQYAPNTAQQNGAPRGYDYPQGQEYNQGAGYGGRPYYSQTAGRYHYG